MLAVFMLVIVSLPSLGAWIETSHAQRGRSAVFVAPFIGSVD